MDRPRAVAVQRSPSVMIAAPAPMSISASAALAAACVVSTAMPVRASASLSFGVTMSHSASMSDGIAAAGAGFRIVRAPPARAICSARWAAGIGCSSWVTKTAAPPIRSARASMSATEMRPAAPGAMMMALLPVACSTKM
jgi:hypothetical protein